MCKSCSMFSSWNASYCESNVSLYPVLTREVLWYAPVLFVQSFVELLVLLNQYHHQADKR
ncbi:hypothetical protein BDR03DRAFT_953055, partial [Suillus americanus]